MRIGYYPGCSLLGSSREFDESVRSLMKALEVELVEAGPNSLSARLLRQTHA